MSMLGEAVYHGVVIDHQICKQWLDSRLLLSYVLYESLLLPHQCLLVSLNDKCKKIRNGVKAFECQITKETQMHIFFNCRN